MRLNNITLIGMTGSGKSVRGKLLAEKLNFKFIDSDEYIKQKEKMSLQQIIDNKGDKYFVKIEEKRILELLPLKKCVLSPGGSVIYSEKLMNALEKSSFIVFLQEPLKVIEKRLTDNKEIRGIVGFKSKSVKELYDERTPLYRKYATITINCFGKSDYEIVNEIIKKLKMIKKSSIRVRHQIRDQRSRLFSS